MHQTVDPGLVWVVIGEALMVGFIIGSSLGLWRGAKNERVNSDYWHQRYIEFVERDTARMKADNERFERRYSGLLGRTNDLAPMLEPTPPVGLRGCGVIHEGACPREDDQLADDN